MRRARRPAAVAAVAAMLLGGTVRAQDTATAQDNGQVIVRATRATLPDDLVRYIAEHAKPTRLELSAFPYVGELSATRVFRTLCGRTSAVYAAAFRARNDLADSYDLAAPLGQDAYRFEWPACLYVSEEEAPSVVVSPDKLVGNLFVNLTGRMGAPNEMKRFFGISDINRVQPGRELTGKFATLPVTLVPESVSSAEFAARVQLHSSVFDGVTSKAAQVSTSAGIDTRISGEILVAATAPGSAGAAYTPPPDCPPRPPKPFDVRKVTAALATLKGLQRDNKVAIAVLDNGFAGARLSGSALQFTTHFPEKLFERWPRSGAVQSIGPNLLVTETDKLEPLVESRPIGPAPHVAGHGTHVTGVLLGGNAAPADAGLYDLGDDDAWLRVSIFPLSAGEQRVSRIALQSAARSLDTSRSDIANLSVRYGADVETELRGVISRNPTTLFVAAAGNASRDVIARGTGEETVFPARLGGGAYRNVITVGAEDGRGYLTHFSNRSAHYVDIAAPGCGIASWLDGETETALSGTSQAAPLVTFTATLLRRYKLDPQRIRRRILLSGDILDGELRSIGSQWQQVPLGDDRPIPIQSRSRLNVAKALLFRHDYVRLTIGEPNSTTDPLRDVALLGHLHVQGGIECDANTDGAMVLALKRSPAGGLWCFTSDQRAPARAAPADDFEVSFTVLEQLDAPAGQSGVFAKYETIPVPIARLREFVRSDEGMTNIEGGN